MARILIVGPHPDDQELGMGGTIAKLAQQGHDLLLLDMTTGEPTPCGDEPTRAREAIAATEVLSPDPHTHPNSKPIRRVQLGLTNRFVEHTIEARHKVAGVIRAHQSQIIFLPYFEDAHPDHRAVTRIVEDARFDAKLTSIEMPIPDGLEPVDPACPPIHPRWVLYYFCTHLRIVPQPSFVVDISEQEELKRQAILAYRSQFVINEKNRAVVDWVMSMNRFYGSRIGTRSGEPFFAREPLGLTGLDSLPL